MEENTPLRRNVGAMKKSGKLWVALIGIAVGILLLLFGGRLADGEGGDVTPPVSEAETTKLTMEEYRQAIERRIATVCTHVNGVGTVTAVVTLEGGYEYVYASDIKTTTSGSSTQYIIIGSGSDEQLVYLTQRVPTITGIGVVCEGGNEPTVRREIIGLLSATFGVGSHKIYVTGGG